jgi:acyl-CoA synthetase (NDP forming)
MFGLGGVLVEVLNDVTFSVAPLDRVEAKKMIRRIKSAKILDGVRGRSELDTESLIFCLLNLSQLVMDFPEIAELDINPLLVLPTGQGCKILDSRILLK